ncbi:MAG: hypothetical protein WA919_08095 [Coleofasciculaceae cyanobacterium]
MAINYPIIETQLRLIRALQKGYVEALEAGDWKAADYRCAHLNKLCEGLNHLSQLLGTEHRLPDAITTKTVTPKTINNWVGTIRSNGLHQSQPNSLNQASETSNKSPLSQPLPPEATRNEWGIGFQGIDQPPIDEVW